MCSRGSSSASSRAACPAASLVPSSFRARRCAVVISMWPSLFRNRSLDPALDFAVLSLDSPRFATGCCAGCSIARGCSRLAVDLLTNALHATLQVISGTAHTRDIAARERIAHDFDLVLNLTAQARRDFVTDILQRPLRLIGQAVGAVARLNLLAALAILLSVHFGFTHHTIDFLLGKAAGAGDRYLLLAPGCLIARRDIENTISIAIE